MPEINPKTIQEQVHQGWERLKNFRKARVMFLRNYVGAYYDKDSGSVGKEPLNLIFNAIKVLVPHIVMQNPKNTVTTEYLLYKEYAELLSLALDYDAKSRKLTRVYRQAIVDAIFTLGTLKTGLADSNSLVVFGEDSKVDPGELFTECVDFDNLLVDPMSKGHLFCDARWIGDITVRSREELLESGLYDNAQIEQLPALDASRKEDAASHLSMKNVRKTDANLDDEIAIAELWVPGANAIVTIPGSTDSTLDDFLRVDDYYGPDSGPYTFLALTPPVPGNPLPVPAVGIWNDLHELANRMASKIVDQATRQKDIIVYRRAAADDAESLQDAPDGDATAVDDPDGVKTISFGGQNNKNEQHLSSLTAWFNQMSNNPQILGGQSSDTDTATEASILANNANIGLDDMKNLSYEFVGEEAGKRAWYIHHDPLIEAPLIRRQETPAQTVIHPLTGQPTLMPGTIEDVQVMLTPEARRGAWLDYVFTITPESMSRVDSQARFRQAMMFATKILPAAMQAAQTALTLGMPFNVKAFIIRMAKDAGIDWMQEVFYDPEFQAKWAAIAQAVPMPQNGMAAPQAPASMSPDALAQNGQPSNLPASPPGPAMEMRQDQQMGANESQSNMRGIGGLI